MWVYIMRHGDTNYYKIGFTRNLPQRLKSIQAHSPLEMSIVKYISGKCAFEKWLQRKYIKYNVRSEWFEFDHKTIKKVSNLSKQRTLYHKETLKFRKKEKETKLRRLLKGYEALYGKKYRMSHRVPF